MYLVSAPVPADILRSEPAFGCLTVRARQTGADTQARPSDKAHRQSETGWYWRAHEKRLALVQFRALSSNSFDKETNRLPER